MGDRVDSDLAAAAAAGLDAAFVLTGGSDRSALDGFEPQPVAVDDTLAGLLNATPRMALHLPRAHADQRAGRRR